MTLTNLQKAESERSSISTSIKTMESALIDHATTPLGESTVDFYIKWADDLKTKLIENLEKINICFPTDSVPYQTEFSKLMQQIASIYGQLHGIKMNFPTRATPSGRQSTSTPPAEIKLPKLEIPAFQGDLQQWISFRDMFLATVHNKQSLSKVEKLTYLKSLIQGEAARQLQDIVLSEANYDLAWKSLTDRYNNERELLFTITKRLFTQPNITPTGASVRQLVDTTKSCIRSLDTLQVQTVHCNPIFVYLIFSKLDNSTKELWLQSLTNKSIPKLEDIFSFLEQRSASMVASGSSSSRPATRGNQQHQRSTQNHHIQPADKCSAGCSASHFIYYCPEFTKMNVNQRIEHIKTNQLCYNCLGRNHTTATCQSKGKCRVCGQRHNSLIHTGSTAGNSSSSSSNNGETTNQTTTFLGTNISDVPVALLATAAVLANGRYGSLYGRALLDSGSSTSLITESYARKLGLSIEQSSVEVLGLSSTSIGEAAGMVQFIFKPHFQSTHKFQVTALVINKITNKLPNEKLTAIHWPHLHNIELEDPQFHTPGNIDFLIGADLFWNILNHERITGNSGPQAISSKLGWLVSGQVSNKPTIQINNFLTNIQLDKQLEKFWDQETISEPAQATPEQEQCMNIYTATHIRFPTGRFMVNIPWKSNTGLGDSLIAASRRFKLLEKRLSMTKFETQRQEYIKFMREYQSMGHMSLVPTDEVNNPIHPINYIPHHFVEKDDSTTTKLRVVFDGSAVTSNGISLNDTMFNGPVVQSSLFEINLRFRLHPIVFVSDIEKMYRQVLISDADRDRHRILWRENPSDPILTFRLNTVTYGTRSASFLATQSLVQLAIEHQQQYPEESRCIQRDSYVDDLQSGTIGETKAINIIKNIIQIGEKACFPFRKWSCNNANVLATIPIEIQETKSLVSIDQEQVIKTLGIYWNSRQDTYVFKINMSCDPRPTYTKRIILSEMSRLFDPMGWVSPVTIKAKILMQDIWKANIAWDQPLPESVTSQWNIYKERLRPIEQLIIQRRFPYEECNQILIVGFADASEKAYAAVVYICGYTSKSKRHTCLLTSKTRVAPIHAVTLPRLELNAAVLLAKLITTVIAAIDRKIDRILAFSDSTITLGWIQSDADRWKTYVKNRVSKIQSLITPENWAHVRGTDNPADCASRGLYGDELVNHKLWWECNTDLIKTANTPICIDMTSVQQEARKAAIICVQTPIKQFYFLTYFSSFQRMQYFIARVLRTQYNFKARREQRELKTGIFTVPELAQSTLEIIRLVQRESFSSEILLLSQPTPVQLSTKHRLLSLNPFIDNKGILRVGGRLRNARIALDQRTPILLPKNHHLTKLIVNHIHQRNLHCGPQQTLALLNKQYWIVRARDIVRYSLKDCVTCNRQKAVLLNQRMGDLPAVRVNPSRSFLKTGVDFCGPFVLKNIGRSKITFKVYVSVFICLVTRAMHLEVVSSLSTDAFLATIKRFVSRRGRPSEVYSDNGTNFVGASKELRKVFQNDTIITHAAKEGITWFFGPPGGPHFGGIWEAGVKSIKYHLRRVMGSTQLTLEEFNTLIIQIEAVLNSRPITAMSTDPNDLGALTPAHFLIGDSLLSIPEPDLSDVNIGRLDRWQMIQQKQQSFWRRWSLEYISRMQQRPKWMQQKRAIGLNDIVIIKDENQPPTNWRLGRVTALHPGEDGLVRVVTLKTKSGDIKRPIVKLCILFDNM